MASLSLTYVAGDKSIISKHEKELKRTDKGMCPCGLKVIREKRNCFSNTWINTGEVCEICEAKEIDKVDKVNQGKEIKVEHVKVMEPAELEVQYVMSNDLTNNHETYEQDDEKAFIEYIHSLKTATKNTAKLLKQEKEAHEHTKTLFQKLQEEFNELYEEDIEELKKEKEVRMRIGRELIEKKEELKKEKEAHEAKKKECAREQEEYKNVLMESLDSIELMASTMRDKFVNSLPSNLLTKLVSELKSAGLKEVPAQRVSNRSDLKRPAWSTVIGG